MGYPQGVKRQIAAAPVPSPRRVIAARYDRAGDLVVVTLYDGVIVGFPRSRLQGLAGATSLDLGLIEVVELGLGLSWPRLDVTHRMPELLGGVYGTRSFMMAQLGARGGAVRSAKRAHASRINGAKGGRPRKAHA